ncbi:hypothetical protein SELMODRAFT_444133 [Selaginella moellendorffii]|uniref:Uncharacterized protein n=2 Tax=Selaginella moellendorffii TaxID=88036 RepID=D8S772_SELML|nr:hypothetical protein SELMODRAFT_444133 [Selaginella moellendorffii]
MVESTAAHAAAPDATPAPAPDTTPAPGPPPGPSALEKRVADLSGPSMALEERAAQIAASVSVRRRAPAPPRPLDFARLENSKFGLKGVFAGFFFVNLAVIGGLLMADRRYKFSPFHPENKWESSTATKRRFRELAVDKERALVEEERARNRQLYTKFLVPNLLARIKKRDIKNFSLGTISDYG